MKSRIWAMKGGRYIQRPSLRFSSEEYFVYEISEEITGYRGDVFVVRTSKPVENV